MTKKTILVFVDWFWPGYLAGGPVQSVISLVSHLRDTYDFKIVTTDRDLHALQAYKGITPDTWQQCDLGCDVFYLSPDQKKISSFRKIIRETHYDCVYLNSFFSYYFSILPLLILRSANSKKPVVIAPGMLGAGALSIKKNKKQVFLTLIKFIGIHRRLRWHATSEQELKEITNVIHPLAKISIIPNLPRKLQLADSVEKKAGVLNVCFVSRISHKKNLLLALELVSQMSADVRFRIYGPKEDELYWEKCQRLIDQMPPHIQVSYEGSVNPNEISGVFSNNHIMLLPTLNENFGHAIIESLSSGCPVITSDQTPWTDLETYGAGFAIPLDNKKAFVNALNHYSVMNQSSLESCRHNAVRYVAEKIKVPEIIQQYKNLFNDCLKN